MHELPLARAALPAPVKIFGLPMRPYSLGHELFLTREQNPLITAAAEDTTRQDLAQAVLICSQRFQETVAMDCQWLTPLNLWAWRRRTSKMPIGPHIQAFIEYRQDGSRALPASSIPRPDRPPGRPAGAPFLLRVYQFLVIEFRLSIDEAWNYPLGLAQFQFATYWEEKGSYEVYNQHDLVHDQKVRELNEEAEREAALNPKPN